MLIFQSLLTFQKSPTTCLRFFQIALEINIQRKFGTDKGGWCTMARSHAMPIVLQVTNKIMTKLTNCPQH